jgi:hypothetical protein
MKINDVITEYGQPSIGTKITATKNGRPIPIQFSDLPTPVKPHQIQQELKIKIPQIGELERMTIARDLAAGKPSKFRDVVFQIQDQKPREM